MPAHKSARRAEAPEVDPIVDEPAMSPLPRYGLPVVATAFAAGMLLGTRTGRALTRQVIRTGLGVVKPALVVGGLLKLNEIGAFRSRPPQLPPAP